MTVEQTDQNAGLDVAAADEEPEDDLGDASTSGAGFVWHWIAD